MTVYLSVTVLKNDCAFIPSSPFPILTPELLRIWLLSYYL